MCRTNRGGVCPTKRNQRRTDRPYGVRGVTGSTVSLCDAPNRRWRSDLSSEGVDGMVTAKDT